MSEALIREFYTAFSRLDAEAMCACYSDDVVFSDPAFGTLRGDDARDMWRLLASRAQQFSLTFDQVRSDERAGAVHWVATYLFSQTGRTVINEIQARFVFRDGKISEHHDQFDFWRWARQAMGTPGLLLGWTPMLRGKVNQQALKGLRSYQAGRAGAAL
jgi:ketosteroid isomerase-like protein